MTEIEQLHCGGGFVVERGSNGMVTSGMVGQEMLNTRYACSMVKLGLLSFFNRLFPLCCLVLQYHPSHDFFQYSLRIL